MSKPILRKYLEIKSLENLKEVKKPSENFSIQLIDSKDFQLNKFFYKNVGKNCNWIDRLVWTDQNWIKHVSDTNLFSYMLKENDEIAGYYELIYKPEKQEAEIAYFGILEEYRGLKLGGYLLSDAIKCSFSKGAKRIWLHTCSNDHKNALSNYLARGMEIFKSETLNI